VAPLQQLKRIQLHVKMNVTKTFSNVLLDVKVLAVTQVMMVIKLIAVTNVPLVAVHFNLNVYRIAIAYE